MESGETWYKDKVLLDWQLELGADEAISEEPINRFESEIVYEEQKTVKTSVQKGSGLKIIDPIQIAKDAVHGVQSLKQLRVALSLFDHCELKLGARNLVFADGNPAARVMIIGEAPGRDEDIQGKPFVGRAGQLLDRMLAAIDLDRQSEKAENAVYITNILPWRPPKNRDPKPDEIAMLLPFVDEHIRLVAPDIVVAMGNIACQALLGERGITRLRGRIKRPKNVDILPMFHPAYLLRTPIAKREAWQDLLYLKKRVLRYEPD